MPPILLLASERSGTNLLRIMFDRHPDISGPPAPHLLRTLSPLASSYGDLADDLVARHFVEDALELCRTNTGPWTCAHDADSIVASTRARTPVGLIASTYAAEASVDGAAFWFCKENELWRFAEEIAALEPETRAVYLHRDGRDAALSYRRSRRVAHTWPRLALKWRAQQAACLEVMNRLGERVNTTTIAYEALVADTERTLRSACVDLEIAFDLGMCTPHQGERARSDAERLEMWRNLDKPVDPMNTNKWLTAARPLDVERFERLAGDMLARLGYELAHTDGTVQPLNALERVADSLSYAFERVRVLLRTDDAARSDRSATIRRIRRRAVVAGGR